MAVAVLTIGGRRYEMACRDGEQAHYEDLGRAIDAKAAQAVQAVGGLPETRLLLLAALLLADDLHEVRAGQATEPADTAGLAAQIEQVAVRIETVAARLEKGSRQA